MTDAQSYQQRTARMEAFLRSPAGLLGELSKDIAEHSLLEYSKLLWPVIEPKRQMKIGWGIEAICEHLEAVTSGEIRRLLINVPPGMMKSLLTEVFWPSWEWGPRNMPHMRYLSASYVDNMPIRDMLKGHRIIDSDLYQHLWGDRFEWDKSQNAKTRYDNTKRGFRIATSVGGLSTGERGDRFIVDDPHNVKTAESEANLDSVAQWITEVVPSRVNNQDESAFVVIMQRVHERDCSGVLLEADLGYVHLNLPMEFDAEKRCSTVVNSNYHLAGERTFTDPREVEGELLFPELFTPKGVAELKKALSSWGGEYAIAGQLQQTPAPRGGGMFKVSGEGAPPVEELYVDAPPVGARVVRAWDIAGSQRKKSPYTVGLKLFEKDGTYTIGHVTRQRLEIEKAEDHIKETAVEDGVHVPISLPQDPGSAGKSQKRHMAKKLDGYDFKITQESGDKEVRAIGIAAQWNNGNVKLVRAPWNKAFLNEASKFPRGTFKDQIDALSRAYGEFLAAPSAGASEGGEVVEAGAVEAANDAQMEATAEMEAAGAGDGWG